MKDYIKDNGKIRNCDYNIAQMNIFEFIRFDIQNGFVKRLFFDTVEQYIEGFKLIFFATINTLGILLLPISLIIRSFLAIKNSKQNVKNDKFKKYKI